MQLDSIGGLGVLERVPTVRSYLDVHEAPFLGPGRGIVPMDVASAPARRQIPFPVIIMTVAHDASHYYFVTFCWYLHSFLYIVIALGISFIILNDLNRYHIFLATWTDTASQREGA